MKLQILTLSLLSDYLEQIPNDLEMRFRGLEDAEISNSTFSFYTSVASVFSSKIEGEDIELDSYIKHKAMGLPFRADYTKKIDDLYNAYTFAKENELTPLNIRKSHSLLANHFLECRFLGKFRSQLMFGTTDDGKIDYVAASPYEVADEMEKLFEDISLLLGKELTLPEVFYFAALIHLVFVKIHPWNDGNGRSARLLEKWFLAKKLGEKAWYIQSEKGYYEHHQAYYNNIRLIGREYADLNYAAALPFLLMLPNSI